MQNNHPPDDLQHRYVVGIDLGTTNSAMACVDLQSPEAAKGNIRFLKIPQLVSPGELADRIVLPSFLYLPGEYDLPAGATGLPWDENRRFAVGELAVEQGAMVPGRLVSSAKSWLAHGGVDRGAPILPWGSGDDVAKVSPVEASARYLTHLRESWDAMMARGREELLLREQLVVLTVPASFDEVARELTVEAAHKAGLPKVVLLEEPLAAFYAWLSKHESDWASGMQAGQLALVCDVGGGTTDFTIIAIREGEKGLRFDRLAVGEHLMLGGDNMDMTLARRSETRMMGAPGKLDAKRWHQLAHQCRKAKETLLGGDGSVKKVDVTIMGTGGRLIADTLKDELTLQEVRELILEGFFAQSPLDEEPKSEKRRGLTEWGLPYVQDAAVTRHLAAFWRRHADLMKRETGRPALYPEYVLFNGGALIPRPIRQRILDVVTDWFRSEAGADYRPKELPNPNPLLAVAIGAAYYGLVRHGQGVRVGAGSPRAYYVEVASQTGKAPEAKAPEAPPAVGDADPESEDEEPEQPPRTAVCLLPRGTEEGFETALNEPSFEVLANRPVVFQLFSSHTRLGDRLGDVVSLAADEITVLPPIRTVLRYGKKGSEESLPVELAVRLTEIGTLELWCQSRNTPHRWRLQFDVRHEVEDAGLQPEGETLDEATIEQAKARVKAVFAEDGPREAPDALMKDLAAVFELEKEDWPTMAIRKLADTLMECKKGREFSFQHEERWLNLLGFCLRPGFGDPLDEWRVRECWKFFKPGPVFPKKGQTKVEWWIFWRRVAGGLTPGQQWHLFQQVSPVLLPSDKKRKGGKNALKGFAPQEEREVWMTLANCERLPAATKADLGRALLGKVVKGKPKPIEYWALGRLGARVPLYGPLDRVLPAEEAARWLDTLLQSEPGDEGLAYSLIQLCRRTGDRGRDLPEESLNRLIKWFAPLPKSQRYRDLVLKPDTTHTRQEQDRIFGESLPSGLVLA